MNKSSIFKFSDYKEFISSQIEASETKWGLISKLAEAAGCQRSYLSRALSSTPHLTPDQIIGLSDHWKLSESECDYFLLLLEKERAATKRFRDRIETKLKAMKREHENLQKRVNRPKAELGEKDVTYYSAWYYAAIHILVSIPKFQTAKAIAERLQMDRALVDEALSKLRDYDLIRQERDRWVFNASGMHVTKDSPLVGLHLSNWRARAVLDAQKRSEESVHYSVVQSVDRRAWESIKAKILLLIDEATEIAGPAKEEILVCLSLDFFEV